jgi:hypothetical protein
VTARFASALRAPVHDPPDLVEHPEELQLDVGAGIDPLRLWTIASRPPVCAGRPAPGAGYGPA